MSHPTQIDHAPVVDMLPLAQQAVVRQLDDAVNEVFALMLDRSCIPQSRSCELRPRFTAIVQFSGSIRGTCTIHLDHCTAIQLAEELTGAPLNDPDTDLELAADTAGELCNMIAGSWKSHLAAELSTCALSPPVIESSMIPGLAEPFAPDFRQRFRRSYRFDDHCVSLALNIE